MMKKERLDLLLVEKALAPSREKAKALIMAGLVYVNQVKIDKPGTLVDSTSLVEIKGNILPYVSRGGLKLEKALRVFSLDLQEKVVMDIGASTGGFTDCALQNGAGKVYAIDVGYGQLDWSLRQDPRVINLERMNARYLTPEIIPELVDVITIDVSFISLEKILPVLTPFIKERGWVLALIKPQFEAGREKVGKKGVVRDPAIHKEVIEKIIQTAFELEFIPRGLDFSPITGPEGNIEYLLWLEKGGLPPAIHWPQKIEEVVNEAHRNLK
jgi:23S rRNA (cytidine1920-2'-O)/16S rRNA (cytidine1409-2'-O)-methyltransferase